MRSWASTLVVCALVGCGTNAGLGGDGGAPLDRDAQTIDEDGGGGGSDGGGGDGGGVVRGPTLVSLSAGTGSTCGVLDDGTVRCWGDGAEGQLGDGAARSSVRPVVVSGIDDAVEVAVGYEYACARHEGGTVSCWGDNPQGRLGDGTTERRATPVTVPGLGDVVDVEVGIYTTCVLRADHTVWCWGRGGDLGDGGFSPSLVPQLVPGLTDVAQLALSPNAGRASSSTQVCGVRGDGTAFCWGANDVGQLGDGTIDSARTPVAVMGLDDATWITAGGGHTCALGASGTRCWGWAAYVGDGQFETHRRVPTAVMSSETFTAIDAGDWGTCAIASTGDVHCWGTCGRGQCGDGVTPAIGAEYRVPTATLVERAVLVAAGADHACAHTSDGLTLCWGDNSEGELGSGTATSLERHPTPTPVMW